MSFISVEAQRVKPGDTVVNLGEVIDTHYRPHGLITLTIKEHRLDAEWEWSTNEVEHCYGSIESVVVSRDLVPVGGVVKLLRNDVGGRWRAGELGEVMVNDYEEKYAYRVLLPGADRQMETFLKLVKPDDEVKPVARIFYFYDDDVEAV